MRLGFGEAEVFGASAFVLPDLSFELKINEIKLCLDCIYRERLNVSVFGFSWVELFYACHSDNYPAQMKPPGF